MLLSCRARVIRHRAAIVPPSCRRPAWQDEKAILKAQEKLRQRVPEMRKYADIYRQEMLLEYNRCQEEEQVRVEFFKQSLMAYQRVLDITAELQVGNQGLAANLQKINAQADLAAFSREKGCDMPMIRPTDEGIFYAEGSTVPVPAVAPISPPATSPPAAATPAAAPLEPPPYSPPLDSPRSDSPAARSTPPAGSAFPVGTRLRALYDYDGSQRADELSFEFDDAIIVVEQTSEVEDGWIKGELESTGAIGVFPGGLHQSAARRRATGRVGRSRRPALLRQNPSWGGCTCR